MKPSETANDLVKMFMPIVGCDNKIQDNFQYERAKKCAIACVNEIIANDYINTDVKYWEQVNKQIARL